jgi:hypothetical protein
MSQTLFGERAMQANEAHAVDGGRAPRFQVQHQRPAATDAQPTSHAP